MKYSMDAFLQLPGAPWYMRFLPMLFGVIVLLSDSRICAFHTRTAYRWFILNGAFGWMGVEMIPVLDAWGFIGYAYFKLPSMIQPVSIFGIYGLGLLNMLLSYALGLALLAWFDQMWLLGSEIEGVNMRRAWAWLLTLSVVFIDWLGLSVPQLDQPEGEQRGSAIVAGRFLRSDRGSMDWPF